MMAIRKGFTLIELLVVVSIIALLVAILMPALNNARQQATGAVCLSDIKNLAIAWSMYTDDNDGRIPFGHSVEFDWNGYIPWACYSGLFANPGQSPLQPKFDAIKRGSLWKYAQDEELYHCPGDKRSLHPSKETRDDDRVLGGFRSFSVPGGLFGVDPVSGGWEVIPILKMSDINSPAEKYCFIEEADGRGGNMGSWVINPLKGSNPNQWIDPISIWHNKRSTLSFVDGHAEMHAWVEQSTLDMAAKQTFNQTLYSGEKGEDLRYMQRGYAYKRLK